jgi:hypothetical protein
LSGRRKVHGKPEEKIEKVNIKEIMRKDILFLNEFTRHCAGQYIDLQTIH